MAASSRALLRLFGEPGFEPRSIGFSLDDQVVGVAGEAIDGTLSADGIRKRGQPFVRPAIRGDDDGARAIALEEQVIEVATLDGVDDVDRKVVEDEEIDGDEFPQLGFVAVIESRMLERFEHLVGADGEHGRPAPAGDVAEGMREKGFADADGADDGDMGVRIEEAQRGELVEERAIEGDLRGAVPVRPGASSDPSGLSAPGG